MRDEGAGQVGAGHTIQWMSIVSMSPGRIRNSQWKYWTNCTSVKYTISSTIAVTSQTS